MTICLRPITTTSGAINREAMRKHDWVRCTCGRPECRDLDLKDKA